ncbi:MAG: alpha/beta hydrolase [Spirochaetes bacterium]|nr:alpha/beta hydrolase [Spirochaetota bacterium]
MRTPSAIICLALCSALLGDCGYLSMSRRDDVRANRDRDAYNSSVLMGSVAGGTGPCLVLAYPVSRPDAKPDDHVVMDRPGPFMLYVPAGTYRIYAFADYNRDGWFDAGEVFGLYAAGSGEASEVTVAEGEVKAGIDIFAGRERPAPVFPKSIRIQDDPAAVPRQPANGEVVRIYDERFCQANADAGWWSPSLFMRGFGARIYLLEEYDPRKIPVLFVHGAQGTPQNWAYFLFRLDRKRYQPWFYYYPSGIRIALASRLLREALLDVKKKYGFGALCIVAHSMGGLVTRDLLTRYDTRRHFNVRLYVTLASPWSGFESADYAFMVPSKKLPVWHDVATNSAFINETLRAKLPQQVRYYLFYGRNDSVAKGRALDERAYGGAWGMFGFDVDHDTILTDRRVFRKFGEVLAKETAR